MPGVTVTFKSSQDDAEKEAEIVIQGAHLMMGYLHEIDNKENRLAKKTEILTGDLGFKDSKGNIYLRPRKDDFFKKSGFKFLASFLKNSVRKE